MNRRVWLAMVGACWWLAACSPTPQAELADVAGELRALRLQLRTTPAAGRDVASGVANAMAPLREALQGLVAAQREQEHRQLQLTQEVQRWGHLVAESLAPTQADEARLVASRLQELEQKLKEQDERHRQVEELLGTALDRASEQLDQFLRQLEPRATAEPAPNAADAAAPPTSSERVVPAAPRQGRVWLWVALLGLSLASSAVLFGLAWRMRGATSRALRDPRLPLPEAASDGAAIPAAGATEPGADRLWAAAALLGEAVETLRSRQAGAAPVAAELREPAAEASPLDDLSIEDLFVLEGLDESPGPQRIDPGHASATVPTAAAGSPTVRSEPIGPAAPSSSASQSPRARVLPEEITVRVRAKDGAEAQHDLLRILHGDPRILQRPAPRLEAQGGHLVVRFALLPGLPAGERSVLEQRLRDSVA